ncbi:MAG TPA: outer membrane porin, OprD family [Sulfuricurvum sp.]|nr:outer membrane porin, OprD family [Sulfuricurvum sp.]
MIKTPLLLILISAALLAIDAIEVSEAGWLHSKQAGRYGTEESEPEMAPWLDGFEKETTLRTLWIDDHIGSQETTSTAVGGFVGLESPQYYGLSANAALYISQRLWGINPPNNALVNTAPYDNTSGFIYFGEAALQYTYASVLLRAGRLRLQTPFADEDDIRMAPDTFEGAAGTFNTNDMTVHLLALRRWAGYDSTDDTGNQSDFKAFAQGSKGTAALGIVYSPNEMSEFNGWVYVADLLFDLGYLEAAGHYYFSPSLHLEWGVQYAKMAAQDASGIAGSVYGAMALLHAKNVYFGGAYNRADVASGSFVTNGFGGGPYYTSLDESTIAGVSELAPGHNVSAYRIGGGADIAWWRHDEDEGLHLEAVYGRFDLSDTDIAVKESDFLVGLGWDESFRLDALFANFDIDNTPDPDYSDFQRYWIRVDYSF